MKTRHHLLQEIEDFLEATGMGPSYFGKVAVGQSELVNRLRRGGEVHTNTMWKLRVFMRYFRIFGRTPERNRDRIRRAQQKQRRGRKPVGEARHVDSQR